MPDENFLYRLDINFITENRTYDESSIEADFTEVTNDTTLKNFLAEHITIPIVEDDLNFDLVVIREDDVYYGVLVIKSDDFSIIPTGEDSRGLILETNDKLYIRKTISLDDMTNFYTRYPISLEEVNSNTEETYFVRNSNRDLFNLRISFLEPRIRRLNPDIVQLTQNELDSLFSKVIKYDSLSRDQNSNELEIDYRFEFFIRPSDDKGFIVYRNQFDYFNAPLNQGFLYRNDLGNYFISRSLYDKYNGNLEEALINTNEDRIIDEMKLNILDNRFYRFAVVLENEVHEIQLSHGSIEFDEDTELKDFRRLTSNELNMLFQNTVLYTTTVPDTLGSDARLIADEFNASNSRYLPSNIDIYMYTNRPAGSGVDNILDTRNQIPAFVIIKGVNSNRVPLGKGFVYKFNGYHIRRDVEFDPNNFGDLVINHINRLYPLEDIGNINTILIGDRTYNWSPDPNPRDRTFSITVDYLDSLPFENTLDFAVNIRDDFTLVNTQTSYIRNAEMWDVTDPNLGTIKIVKSNSSDKGSIYVDIDVDSIIPLIYNIDRSLNLGIYITNSSNQVYTRNQPNLNVLSSDDLFFPLDVSYTVTEGLRTEELIVAGHFRPEVTLHIKYNKDKTLLPLYNNPIAHPEFSKRFQELTSTDKQTLTGGLFRAYDLRDNRTLYVRQKQNANPVKLEGFIVYEINASTTYPVYVPRDHGLIFQINNTFYMDIEVYSLTMNILSRVIGEEETIIEDIRINGRALVETPPIDLIYLTGRKTYNWSPDPNPRNQVFTITVDFPATITLTQTPRNTVTLSNSYTTISNEASYTTFIDDTEEYNVTDMNLGSLKIIKDKNTDVKGHVQLDAENDDLLLTLYNINRNLNLGMYFENNNTVYRRNDTDATINPLSSVDNFFPLDIDYVIDETVNRDRFENVDGYFVPTLTVEIVYYGLGNRRLVPIYSDFTPGTRFRALTTQEVSDITENLRVYTMSPTMTAYIDLESPIFNNGYRGFIVENVDPNSSSFPYHLNFTAGFLLNFNGTWYIRVFHYDRADQDGMSLREFLLTSNRRRIDYISLYDSDDNTEAETDQPYIPLSDLSGQKLYNWRPSNNPRDHTYNINVTYPTMTLDDDLVAGVTLADEYKQVSSLRTLNNADIETFDVEDDELGNITIVKDNRATNKGHIRAFTQNNLLSLFYNIDRDINIGILFLDNSNNLIYSRIRQTINITNSRATFYPLSTSYTVNEAISMDEFTTTGDLNPTVNISIRYRIDRTLQTIYSDFVPGTKYTAIEKDNITNGFIAYTIPNTNKTIYIRQKQGATPLELEGFIIESFTLPASHPPMGPPRLVADERGFLFEITKGTTTTLYMESTLYNLNTTNPLETILSDESLIEEILIEGAGIVEHRPADLSWYIGDRNYEWSPGVPGSDDNPRYRTFQISLSLPDSVSLRSPLDRLANLSNSYIRMDDNIFYKFFQSVAESFEVNDINLGDIKIVRNLTYRNDINNANIEIITTDQDIIREIANIDRSINLGMYIDNRSEIYRRIQSNHPFITNFFPLTASYTIVEELSSETVMAPSHFADQGIDDVEITINYDTSLTRRLIPIYSDFESQTFGYNEFWFRLGSDDFSFALNNIYEFRPYNIGNNKTLYVRERFGSNPVELEGLIVEEVTSSSDFPRYVTSSIGFLIKFNDNWYIRGFQARRPGGAFVTILGNDTRIASILIDGEGVNEPRPIDLDLYSGIVGYTWSPEPDHRQLLCFIRITYPSITVDANKVNRVTLADNYTRIDNDPDYNRLKGNAIEYNVNDHRSLTVVLEGNFESRRGHVIINNPTRDDINDVYNLDRSVNLGIFIRVGNNIYRRNQTINPLASEANFFPLTINLYCTELLEIDSFRAIGCYGVYVNIGIMYRTSRDISLITDGIETDTNFTSNFRAIPDSEFTALVETGFFPYDVGDNKVVYIRERSQYDQRLVGFIVETIPDNPTYPLHFSSTNRGFFIKIGTTVYVSNSIISSGLSVINLAASILNQSRNYLQTLYINGENKPEGPPPLDLRYLPRGLRTYDIPFTGSDQIERTLRIGINYVSDPNELIFSRAIDDTKLDLDANFVRLDDDPRYDEITDSSNVYSETTTDENLGSITILTQRTTNDPGGVCVIVHNPTENLIRILSSITFGANLGIYIERDGKIYRRIQFFQVLTSTAWFFPLEFTRTIIED